MSNSDLAERQQVLFDRYMYALTTAAAMLGSNVFISLLGALSAAPAMIAMLGLVGAGASAICIAWGRALRGTPHRPRRPWGLFLLLGNLLAAAPAAFQPELQQMLFDFVGAM